MGRGAESGARRGLETCCRLLLCPHSGVYTKRTWKAEMLTQMDQKMRELRLPAKTLYSSSTLRALIMLNICRW